jgi:hypothetical protein
LAGLEHILQTQVVMNPYRFTNNPDDAALTLHRSERNASLALPPPFEKQTGQASPSPKRSLTRNANIEP